MKKRMLLLFFMLSSAASCCISGGFRHYDPMTPYLPSVKTQRFVGPLKQEIPFSDPEVEELVCFKTKDFVKHEKECRAK